MKQNLIVCPDQDELGRFAVTAGGRRLKALQELAAEGAIAADCEVPCLVEEADASIETSLMENMVRAAMHPADEFAAMAALIDSGATVEAIAARFGVSNGMSGSASSSASSRPSCSTHSAPEQSASR